MNNFVLAMLLSLASFGLLVSGCNDKQEVDPAAAEQQAPPPVTVSIMPVKFQTVPLQTEFAGRTVAFQEAEVRPRATGVIKEILYQEGGMVKEGQPLYRLSIDNYESATIANQAAVNQAAANVSTAQASYNTAVANRASQLALLEQAKADLDRLAPLVEMNAISRQQYDQAITKFKTTQAALASTEATIAQAQANIDSANAAVESAQAKLTASNIEFNRTTVTAPISGLTDRSSVTVGTLVNANQSEPLVTISKINPIYVDFNQSSAELLALKRQQASGELQPGSQIVELILEDGSTYPVKGRLRLAEAKADEATGSVIMRAQFDNSNYLLLPGMFVTIRMTKGILPKAVLLPQSGLKRTPKGETLVNIVDSNNIVEVRPVTVAGTYKNKWIVTGGLQAGENVVIMGGSYLRPEQVVNVQPLPDANTAVAPNSNPSNTGTGQSRAEQSRAEQTNAGQSDTITPQTLESTLQSEQSEQSESTSTDANQ